MAAGAQELANVIKKNEDGKFVITPEAEKVFYERFKQALNTGKIELPFPCAEPGPVLQQAKNELDNIEEFKKKYPNFHDFWVDGIVKSIAEKLNVQPNFAIPIFDPLALGNKLGLPAPLPAISIQEASVSFAAPIPIALELLEVKPQDIPKLASKALSLVVPSPPSLPEMNLEFSKPPGINTIDPYGSLQVGIALNLGVQTAFVDLVVELAKPDFWLNFSLASIFELSCKTVKQPILKPFTGPETGQQTPPITGIAAASTVQTMVADQMAFATTTAIVGGGVILDTEAVQAGYKKPLEQAKEADQRLWPYAARQDPSLIKDAPLHRLQPFLPDPDIHAAKWVFKESGRNTFFADPWIIELLYATAAHFNDLNKKGNIIPAPYILEVGNLCGRRDSKKPFDKNTYVDLPLPASYDKRKLNSAWRWSPWSDRTGQGQDGTTSHAGANFDYAYPLIENGKRISGMYPGHCVVDNPLNNQHGLRVTGLSFSEKFADGPQKGKSPRSAGIPRELMGDRPFRPLPGEAVNKDLYDWATTYELLRFMCVYTSEQAKKGRLKGQDNKPLESVDAISQYVGSAEIGKKAYSYYQEWRKKQKNLKDSNLIKINLDPNPTHEDHLHFNPYRSHVEADLSKEEIVYRIRPSARGPNRAEKEQKDPASGNNYWVCW